MGCMEEKLYVEIIMIHGMLIFHVAHIYTCNMKENALASCISYAQAHRVESGAGARYGLFTSLGEWVVGSENGTKSKPFKWQVSSYVCWVK